MLARLKINKLLDLKFSDVEMEREYIGIKTGNALNDLKVNYFHFYINVHYLGNHWIDGPNEYLSSYSNF